MPPRRTDLVAQLRSSILREEDALTDGQLVARFLERRDGEAFAAIVRRHGPMVWGVCRRLLADHQDAEDAFQAAFLVLARKARSLRDPQNLAGWLYGVAHKTASKARALRARRRIRERQPAEGVEPVSPGGDADRDRSLDLDGALRRLPERYRSAIVLCDLLQRTQKEASRHFGVPEGTVSGWLTRGRAMLAERLSSHGAPVGVVALAALFDQARASAGLSPELIAGTSGTAAGVLGGQSLANLVSPDVFVLTREVVNAMAASKLKLAAVLVLALAASGIGIGLLLKDTPVVAGPLAKQSNARKPPPVPEGAEPPVPAADPPAADPPTALGTLGIGSPRFRLTSGWHKKIYFTADGKSIVAPLENKAVETWDPVAGRRTGEIKIPRAYFKDSDYHGAGHLLALLGWRTPEDESKPTECFIWFVDTKAGKVVRELSVPKLDHSVGEAVRFTPDGKRLVVAFDRQIRILDVKTGEEVIRQNHKGGSQGVSISPDGKTIAFGQYALYLWDWELGGEPRKFATGGVQASVFTADGKALIVAGYPGGRARTFEIATGREVLSFDSSGYVRSWTLSPDGGTVVGSGRGKEKSGQVVLRDPATGKERCRLPIGQAEMMNAAFSPDGTRLAAVSDNRLWTWDVKTMKPLGTPEPGHEGTVTAFDFGPDGRLYTASDDHTIRSWDGTTGKPLQTLTHANWVRGVAVSPDGMLVAGSALGNDLRIWDAKSGTERFKLTGNGVMGGKRLVRFTPDGGKLVAWGDDMFLRTWDVRTGKLLAEHRTQPDGVTEEKLADERQMIHLGIMSASLSDDASTLAMAPNGKVQIFDTATGEERSKFQVDPNGVTALALSPDGKRLAVSGNAKHKEIRIEGGGTRGTREKDHLTAVWDVAGEKKVWEATASDGWGSTILFSQDGTRVAEQTTDEDEAPFILVRDAAQGKVLGRVKLMSKGWHFAFDRTGMKIVASNNDTTVTLYDLDAALEPVPPK